MNKKDNLQVSIKNKKGQMAIFIVLIFQILFVLFAMVINIGLIVHDKINLQNSVDLAAYYAAQRQAELLNGIAHQNYQIRQAWKLLSWRYFTLGTSSLISDQLSHYIHPANPKNSHGPREEDNNGCFIGFKTRRVPDTTRRCQQIPIICIFDLYPWSIGNATRQSFCKNLTLSMPSLHTSPGTALFGLFGRTNTYIKNANKGITTNCNNASQVHQVFATSILTAFDREQSYRLKILYKMATRLKKNKDIDNQSIRLGAKQTFTNNLSYANCGSAKSTKCKYTGQFIVKNSLKKVKNSQWLVPIVVNPGIVYAQFKPSPAVGCASNESQVLSLDKKDKVEDAFEQIFNIKPTDIKLMLAKIHSGKQSYVDDFANNNKENPQFYAVGVEKNPWYKVYSSVTATSSPRELFWLGNPIKLKAKAYAAPFGGRVGPWYGKTWSQANKTSTGVREQERVDLMLPPRNLLINNGPPLTLDQILESIPNFSTYPGDKMGLFSYKALGAIKLPENPKYKLHHLINSAFAGEFKDRSIVFTGKQRSSLSGWKSSNENSPRDVEIKVLTPNLFDITYYSVFPDAKHSFIGRFDKSEPDPENKTREDMGNYTKTDFVTLKERLSTTFAVTGLNFIKKTEEVLNSWVPNGPYSYGFNKQAFQKCNTWGKTAGAPVTGACAAGGRVGYSVKLVSGAFLKSQQLSLGGENESPGRLKNPPQ